MGKVYEEKTTYIVVNNSEEEKTIDLTGTALEMKELADTLSVLPSAEKTAALEGNVLVLPAFETCILK